MVLAATPALLALIRKGSKFHKFYSTQPNDDLKILRHVGNRKGVLELGLNRSSAKNAFSKSLLRALQSAIIEIKNDQGVRVVVLRSLVPGVFCAGADLKERTKLTESEVVEFVSDLRNTLEDLANIPPPTIAALDGVALGGGLELALACDIRVANQNTRLGLVETKLAIIPGAGGTQRLPRLINSAIAKELVFTASVLNGADAHKLGLVNHVVEENQSHDAAYLKAMEIAEKILPNGPIGVKLAKKAMNRGLQVDLKSGLQIEEALYAQVVPTKDRVEGLLAFREKRAPVYKGE